MRIQMVVDMRPRHVVTTGHLHTVIYDGHNRERAIEIANFWDERQDTWLETIAPPTNPLARAMWRFDRLQELIANA